MLLQDIQKSKCAVITSVPSFYLDGVHYARGNRLLSANAKAENVKITTLGQQ